MDGSINPIVASEIGVVVHSRGIRERNAAKIESLKEEHALLPGL